MTYNVSIPSTVPRTLIRTAQLNPILAAMRAATAGTVLTGTGAGEVAWESVSLSGSADVDVELSPGGAAGAQEGDWLIASTGSPTPAEGGLGAWGTRPALVEIRDLNAVENNSCALLLRIVEDQSPPTQIRTGLHINAYTGPDDGGESSAALIVQSGAGGTLTVYKSFALRPPGMPDLAYQHGSGLEISAQDMGAAIRASAGAAFPISHVTENGYAVLSSGINAAVTSLPVDKLERVPLPGSAGIYAPGSWPTPLYLKLDNEYVSYTGKSAASGAGTVTGVIRGVAGTTAAVHSAGIGVETVHAQHALHVALGRPISKGIIIEPGDGVYDTRPAIWVGSAHLGSPADDAMHFVVQMNGNVSAVGTITGANLQATGNVTANANISAPAGTVTGVNLQANGNLTVNGTSTLTGAVALPANTVTTANLQANAVTQTGRKSAAANVTTTSVSLVVMPDDAAGEMSVTLTTTGGPLLMTFVGTLSNGTNGGVNALAFSIDGASTGDLMAFTACAVGAYGSHTISYLATGYGAGSHTVRVLWRVNSGTASAFGRSLTVVELKR